MGSSTSEGLTFLISGGQGVGGGLCGGGRVTDKLHVLLENIGNGVFM